MDQRNKAEVRELFFATVGYRNLGGAFERDLAFIGAEGVKREPLHQSSALNAAYGHAPVVERERFSQPGAERVGGVAPQILLVVGAVAVLFEVECLGRLSLLPVRNAHQRVRETEAHVA